LHTKKMVYGMTCKEYAQAQKMLKMTNLQFAHALGVTQDTIVKRKYGRIKITMQAEKAVINLMEKMT